MPNFIATSHGIRWAGYVTQSKAANAEVFIAKCHEIRLAGYITRKSKNNKCQFAKCHEIRWAEYVTHKNKRTNAQFVLQILTEYNSGTQSVHLNLSRYMNKPVRIVLRYITVSAKLYTLGTVGTCLRVPELGGGGPHVTPLQHN